MRLSVLIAAATVALAMPVNAAAQQPAAAQDFGGGAVNAPPASPFSAGNMVIGLHSLDATRLQVSATIVGSCASGTFVTVAPVAADGTFSTSGDVRQANTRTTYELHGTLTATPSGTATAHFERATARGTRRCSAEDVAWQARAATDATDATTAIGEPAMVPAGALLLGTTTQHESDARHGIAVRISADGRSVARAIYGVKLHCSHDVSSPTFDLPQDDLAILPDGRVSNRESGTRRTKTTILRYVERFAATLGSAGGDGMFSVQLTVRRREDGRRVTRCRSGSVRWSATY
jgi:hypothetical protein